MKLTENEKYVIAFLADKKISTKYEMCEQLNIAPITVIRALNKYGYYSSYNKNAAYYTLKDIPVFDSNGIWFYEQIGFSYYGTIQSTVSNLINKSLSGYTAIELGALLQTDVKNILSRLRRQDLLAKFNIGHQAVYVSTEDRTRKKQIDFRLQTSTSRQQEKKQLNFEQGFLPEGIDVNVVLLTLVKMIMKPDSSDASISKSIQAYGLPVTAKQIRRIISFYGLEKKRVH